MSGQQIGTVVGGFVGLWFGNPQLGMMIGGMIGGAIDPEVIKGPSIGDAQKQTTQAGVPRPVVYGHPAPFMGNIIDGEHKARKIIVEEDGKGGPTVEHERFLLTSAIRICEGPIAGVIRIWRNGEVVYDRRTLEDLSAPDNTSVLERMKYMAQIRAKTAAFQNKVRIYLGTEDQLPDPALEAMHGVGNTPYYRGTAYMVIEDDDVTDTRGACAQYEFEVASQGMLYTVVDTLESYQVMYSGNSGSATVPRLTIAQKKYSTSNTLPVPYPVQFRLTASTGSESRDNVHRRSIVTSEGKGVIWDSGWVSATPNKTALDDLLEAEGREDLKGQIATGGDVSRTFLDGVGPTDITLNTYIAQLQPGGYGVLSEMWTVQQYQLPESFYSVPELPGAILGSDGVLYYPDWVPPGDLEAISPSTIQLSDVVEDIADRCGVPASKLDLSDISADLIPGFLIATQSTGADCIRPTQQVYFYDMPEFDGLLAAVKRGGVAVADIAESDMVDIGPDDDSTRPQALEYPLKVSVVSQDPAADYAPVPQTSSRFSAGVQAKGEVLIQTPVPFSADEAKQRADILHKVLWAQAEGRTEFQLPEEWTWLVPSDCFDMGGKRWFIEDARYADGVVKIQAVYDRASNYTSNATGQAPTPPVLPDTGIRGPTILAVMNLPPLREQDESVSGVYLAATGSLSSWNGAAIQMSVDGGATFRTVAAIGTSSVIGTLKADITASSEPITVSLVSGDLYSTNPDEIALGANAFALVPASAPAEIGQFETATETGAGEYELTDVTRGVKETEAVEHFAGEQFVMLGNAVFLPVDSSLVGETLIFRAVTNGTIPEDNATVSMVYDPVPVDVIIDGGTI